MVLPKGHALHSKAREMAGQHLTVLLCERAARSESLLSGIASTRLWRPPAAQQMTRHLSGPPAHARAHLAMLAADTHSLFVCTMRALTEQAEDSMLLRPCNACCPAGDQCDPSRQEAPRSHKCVQAASWPGRSV